MNQQKIRILILDDISAHLNKIEDVLKSTTYQVSNKNWKIEIIAIKVVVVEQGGKFSFDTNCIKEIEQASCNPFDLLLLDIGYRHEDLKIDQHLQPMYEKDPQNYYSRTWKSKGCLSPDDLVMASKNSNFKKKFVGHKNSIFGYTYIPSGKEHLFYTVEKCKDLLTEAFPNARIEMKGTREELFRNFPEVINEKEFYPYILAKYLEKLIYIEILKKEINNAKHLKIKRTSIAVGILVFICGILGACSEFIGSLIFKLFQEGNFLTAILCVIGFFVSIIICGALIVKMSKQKIFELFIGDAPSDT